MINAPPIHAYCRTSCAAFLWEMAETDCPILNARKRALRRVTSDPWQTLGVSRNAPQEAIEAAFRQRMAQAFPDPEGDLTGAYIKARRKALDRCGERERRRARVNHHFREIFGTDWGRGSMTVIHSRVKVDASGNVIVRFDNGEAVRF